ncbi:MAG TPA: hypothetical protein PLX97_01845 [Gemmatales bacterium]|nr:hypothetical protein [Gemmatales bacterium]
MLMFLCLCGGCRWGAPPSKTPFGAEHGIDGPFNMVANAFYADLKASRFAEAYARTSPGYQKQISKEAFIDMMKAHPFLSGAGAAGWSQRENKDASTRSYEYHEDDTTRNITLSFDVTLEGLEYRVSAFKVEK